MKTHEASVEIPIKERVSAAVQLLGGIAVGLSSPGTRRELRAERLIGNHNGDLIADNSFNIEDYEALLAQTDYWHGTGRYYTTWDNNHVDVLEGILLDGKIRAFFDATDHRYEPASVVAASPNRMHARIYADTHATNLNEQVRYGQSSFWLGVFAGSIAKEMISDRSLGNFAVYTIKNALRSGKVRQPRTQRESVMFTEGLLRGSSVADNFPILIGIRVDEDPMKKHTHEARFSEVLTTQFTHLQVPRDCMLAVRAALDAHNLHIPIISIEDAEAYASTKPMSQLLPR